ncbi:alkaline phosphatase [Flavobacterium johnsoniae]|uniref:Alkaline phosphatase n=1 Tax=Flavobacterium johnsoniae (strain ATCC 17061 / DSM 2064 / JCM 8514 / BCRC 14874 / CCUG 350202 / NBRC 14942 / NCIMB 11054 / UW101) TaxID=376686 RepID=A5FF14_FLAJ1|nr:alkaline phosphatase [Flavobacterium johnsoniae]ABQ06204.1 Alkaline phosphatase [Flavobacterium johnsoniae UW101]OXE98325.1 alkaline phosphatase [Flavobacterium johnsoniae UW101]WQG81950.1 alkaline phosphatase [Flavobacterium johnsoniae UW101]SHK68792.1 alkaline phosphatase [Flavobacterium johnsoniae]
MNRRRFLKGSTLLSGLAVMSPTVIFSNDLESISKKNKKAKNIIFLISDGMSTGTLQMANLYSQNILNKNGNWMNLYAENKVSRALMDTASASSAVTDSAAASSSFGGGYRVRNGVLNVGPNGEKYLPIWQKFKNAGKKAGCVTTVTITHATPAGFCVNSDSRNAENEIAEMYAGLGLDVLMGGGDEFFNPDKRSDKKDIYKIYQEKGYKVVKDKTELGNLKKGAKTLGVFSTGALPYSIDRTNIPELQHTPTLAEMSKAAIDQMKDHKDGFVLLIEGGKVDWAAHANDIAALIHDQLAFDEAVKTAIDFAEKDTETLVIITTDHGNANPGLIYGTDATKKFNSIADYKYTNEYILNAIHSNFNLQQIKDWIYQTNKISLSDQEAQHLLDFYSGLEKMEDGLYNYKKLPFKAYSEIQKKHNNIGWISMDHSGDYVELAAFGPGSELLKPFVKNTDMHYLMLEAAMQDKL